MAQIYKHYITYKSADDFTILNNFFYNREMTLEDPEEDKDEAWITYYFWTPYALDNDEQEELYGHPHCLDWAFNREEIFQHSVGIQDRLLRTDLEQIFADHKQKVSVGDASLHIDFQTAEEYKAHSCWSREELSDEIIDAILKLPGVHHVKTNQSVWTDGDF